MKNINERNILYDFYGDLLTDHRKKIYEDAVFGDFSLSELSETYGITRQGIHDLLKRCDKVLNDYEEKLHMIEKFYSIRGYAEQISELSSTLDDEKALIISDLADKIIESL